MKVLVAGLGSIGQRHVRNLRALLGAEVEILAYRARGLSHVITDRMEIEAGRTVDERYRLRSFTCLDAALAQHPDAAIVCNPSSLHVRTARAVVEAGCHVLIEKPLSDASDGIDELMELSEQKSLVAAVGYQMRFHPALLRLRALLRGRAIGRVLAVRAEMAEYLPDAHPYEDYRDSYAARSDLGGGVVLCYIHEFDYLQWLFGAPRRIFTVGGRLGDLDIDVEDTAVSSLACIVDDRPVPVQVHQSFVQRPRSRTCVVMGDAGAIHLDLNAPSLTRTDRAGIIVEQEPFSGFERNQLFMDELKHFLACVAGDETPAVPLREAAPSLRMALAARESLRTGLAVALP